MVLLLWLQKILLALGEMKLIELDFEDFKERIKGSRDAKKYLDKVMADGYSEEEAVEILLRVYCKGMGIKLKC